MHTAWLWNVEKRITVDCDGVSLTVFIDKINPPPGITRTVGLVKFRYLDLDDIVDVQGKRYWGCH